MIQQHGSPKVTGVSDFARIRHLLLEAVWVYLRPYWKVHAPIAAGVVVLVLFEAALPLTIRFLIDEALLPHDSRKLILALGLLVLFFAAAAVSRFVLAVVRAHIARELYWDLSTGIFRSLQRLPLAYFDRVADERQRARSGSPVLQCAATGHLPRVSLQREELSGFTLRPVRSE